MPAAGMSLLATVGPWCHTWGEGVSPGGVTISSTGSTRVWAGDPITYCRAYDAYHKITRHRGNRAV